MYHLFLAKVYHEFSAEMYHPGCLKEILDLTANAIYVIIEDINSVHHSILYE